MQKPPINCFVCGKVFNPTRWQKSQFCSHSCGTKHQMAQKPKPATNLKCAYCGKEFYRAPNKQKAKTNNYFCCKLHKSLAQRLDGGLPEIMPEHYGKSNKYRRIAYIHKGFIKCELCGYNEFTKVLEVHHKDRNRKNNKVENLQVLCPTCHRVEHYNLRNNNKKFSP